MKKLLAGAAVLAGLAAPLLSRRPVASASGPVVDVDDAVHRARATGLTGLALIQYCCELVGHQFETQTLRSPWEPGAVAFARRRGYSMQYNGVLAEILSRLGFQAELVFAARVRRPHAQPPWYAMGHAWVRVTIDGRRRAVCARYGGMGGEHGFVPLTQIHVVSALTLVDTTVAATTVSLLAQWWAILARKPLPYWFESPFRRSGARPESR